MSKVKRGKSFPQNDQGKEEKLNNETTTNSLISTQTVNSLPAELLKSIFEKIESPTDLLNCWNTSPAWADALRSTDFYFRMTLPFVLPYLDAEDLLKCSFVSKSWNATVDIGMQSSEDFDESDTEFNERLFLELDPGNFTHFIDTFGLMTNNDSGGNIFEANHVITLLYRRSTLSLSFGDRYILDDEPGPEQIKQQVAVDHKNMLQCLNYYGHLVHGLVLTISGEDNVSCLDKMKLIQRCLKRTPNLRYLKIKGYKIRQNVQNQLTAFNEYNAENPWPPLEHLKVLKMNRNVCTSGREEYVTIANAYASQLLCFTFGYETTLPQTLLRERFSNLQKIYFSVTNFFSTTNLEEFVRLSGCPLRHLIIALYSPCTLNKKRINGLVNAANFVSATLETLEFRLGDFKPRKNLDITKFDQLRLPNLRELKLDTFGFPLVNFLQSVCPAVQMLTVHSSVVVSQSVDSTDETEADMYADLYSDHNFWKLADIRRVDVAYTVGPIDITVDNERTGKKVKMVILGEHVRKVYSRKGYEANVGNEAGMGDKNQSSSSSIQKTTHGRGKCQKTGNRRTHCQY